MRAGVTRGFSGAGGRDPAPCRAPETRVRPVRLCPASRAPALAGSPRARRTWGQAREGGTGGPLVSGGCSARPGPDGGGCGAQGPGAGECPGVCRDPYVRVPRTWTAEVGLVCLLPSPTSLRVLSLGALEGSHARSGVLNPGRRLYRALPISEILGREEGFSRHGNRRAQMPGGEIDLSVRRAVGRQ